MVTFQICLGTFSGRVCEKISFVIASEEKQSGPPEFASSLMLLAMTFHALSEWKSGSEVDY